MAIDEVEIIDESVAPADVAIDRINEIAKLPDVTKVVGFSDLHQDEQETPTSIATATRGSIYPELSSNVVNCGMSLITTDLTKDDITRDFVAAFCDDLRARSSDMRPTRDDVIQMLLHGADYVIDQTDRDPSIVEHIENGGSMFTEKTRPDAVTDIVPSWLLRHPGTTENTPVPSLSSNHFIEFQAIEDIIDDATAADWGLSEDQIVLFMHGDYALTFYLNWHHANRLKFRENIAFPDRLKMQISKAAFHLQRSGLRKFNANWRLYNSQSRFTRFDVDSAEGKHLINVIYACMNFAYANRLLASLCLQESLSAVHSNEVEAKLLWDVGHDTIQREPIAGEELWVHRKGAAKAVPGKPAIIAGSYNMNSFIGKCQDGATHLNSYDHGTSHIIEHLDATDGLAFDTNETMMFDLSEGHREDIAHIESTPVKTVTQNLTANGILSEVAYLRPIANISE